MTVRVVRLGSPRIEGEGTRIGTVRRPPRGVPKSEFASQNWYDVLENKGTLFKIIKIHFTNNAKDGGCDNKEVCLDRPNRMHPGLFITL